MMTEYLAWAVRSATKEDGAMTVTLSFTSHKTPEAAIKAHEEHTGLKWEECEKRGDRLVQVPIVLK